MTPTLIIAGIQATLRAAQAGADLYAEHARDRTIFLPDLQLPAGDREDQLNAFIPAHPDLLATVAALRKVWNPDHGWVNADSRPDLEAAYAAMLEWAATAGLADADRTDAAARREAGLQAGGRLVEQWRKDKKPPTPLARAALTLVDIGLEFVSSNPSILGQSSRGEKLVVAFAENMTVLIPDDVAAFGSQTDFADRVLGIFLRAGLATLAQGTAVVIPNENVARLLQGVIAPVVAALPERVDQQFEFRRLVDALAGPAAEAAFRILAENTESYLGRSFASDKALGVVTAALFQQIQETAGGGSLVEVFSESGLIRLYQAGLSVAVDRPELFTGDQPDARTRLFRELLSGAAGTLRQYPRFRGPLAASLAASVVETVGRNAPALLRLQADQPWESIAQKALEQLTAGLAGALRTEGPQRPGALKAFTDNQLVELARVVLNQIAQTPGMLGIERTQLQAIVAGIAEAVGQDEDLLLSAEQWLSIASRIADQAAANPGRLFGLNPDKPEEALLVQVIGSILKTARGQDPNPNPPATLLFGPVLEQVITLAVDALAGNIDGIRQNPTAIATLLETLLGRATATPDRVGSLNLVRLFEKFVGRVVAKGTQPPANQITRALAA